jgi:hypothetical protein
MAAVVKLIIRRRFVFPIHAYVTDMHAAAHRGIFLGAKLKFWACMQQHYPRNFCIFKKLPAFSFARHGHALYKRLEHHSSVSVSLYLRFVLQICLEYILT